MNIWVWCWKWAAHIGHWWASYISWYWAMHWRASYLDWDNYVEHLDTLRDWLESDRMNDFCSARIEWFLRLGRFSIKFPSWRQQHLLWIQSRHHNHNHNDHEEDHGEPDDDDHDHHDHDNHDVQWSCLHSIVRHSEADRWEILSIVGQATNITLRYKHYWRLPTLQCDMLPKWTAWSWGGTRNNSDGFSKQVTTKMKCSTLGSSKFYLETLWLTKTYWKCLRVMWSDWWQDLTIHWPPSYSPQLNTEWPKK